MKIKMTVFRLRHSPSTGSRLVLLYALLASLALDLNTALANTTTDQLIAAANNFLEQSVPEHLERSQIQGRYAIEINRLDPRLQLAPCPEALSVTLESPAQPIGRVTTRIRCEGATPWTVFVPAQVRLYREVLVATRPLMRNTELQASDLAVSERDVSQLNQGYLTDLTQAVGMKLTRQVQPDQVLTPVFLAQREMIRKGDQVMITASNSKIGVHMQGEALSAGGFGQQINVRNLSSQRIIKARITGPGKVEVSF